jgi:ketosteroid isomerase-like protein
MDRWCKGDPSGYIDIFASDVTVLDARTERTLSGINEVMAYYEPIRGKVSIPRYEFVRLRVQLVGDAAILTYNFVSCSESNQVMSRWNFTQVYRRADPTWKVFHSHASYTLGRPAENP